MTAEIATYILLALIFAFVHMPSGQSQCTTISAELFCMGGIEMLHCFTLFHLCFSAKNREMMTWWVACAISTVEAIKSTLEKI